MALEQITIKWETKQEIMPIDQGTEVHVYFVSITKSQATLKKSVIGYMVSHRTSSSQEAGIQHLLQMFIEDLKKCCVESLM